MFLKRQFLKHTQKHAHTHTHKHTRQRREREGKTNEKCLSNIVNNPVKIIGSNCVLKRQFLIHTHTHTHTHTHLLRDDPQETLWFTRLPSSLDAR